MNCGIMKLGIVAKWDMSSVLIAVLMTVVPQVVSSQPSSHVPYVPAQAGSSDKMDCLNEPDVEKALGWWVPQRGVWTPLGWKDHLFRFTVPYNGALLCSPFGVLGKPHTEKFRGRDFQLTFHPSVDGDIPPMPTIRTRLHRIDGGFGKQGWREDQEAPVLYTRWPLEEGLVLKTESFAHMQGGGEVTTATEPLYAWVRMSVDHVDEVEHPEKFSFAIQLSKIWYLQSGMAGLDEIAYLEAVPELATLDAAEYTSSGIASASGGNAGFELLQDGKIRLRVLPGGDGKIRLRNSPDGRSYVMQVEFPVKKDAHVDMLVPMLPEPTDVLNKEAALGYDGALAESNKYWVRKPDTAAEIHTPENYINQALKRNIQFAEVIAELNPENGEYSFLSGSYGYDALWSTPTSMVSHMFLDLLGYHDIVEKHIELYLKNQGTIKPPGESYETHPGYFSTPKSLASLDWLGDHGAIMEILSRHALLTGRADFVEHWIQPLIKACEFIKVSTAATGHTGVKGIMPPAIATDSLISVQAIWTQVWTYKGLDTTVRLLKEIDHPRSAEFEKMAADFKAAFGKAFEAKIKERPKWNHPNGNTYPVLPDFLLAPPERHIYDDAFLLDTGALSLPWAGLFDAADPRMEAFGDYFRVGPPAKLWGPRSSSISRAILMHEISSCEPCYSWNIVNSWKTGNRKRFIEGMYALFTGAISPQTFINCEHRNNMYGTLFVAPLMTWCMRQSVIDDQLEPDKLHLLRLCPLAWISTEEETLFKNMPTEFGPVDLVWRLEGDGKILNLKVSPKWRRKPVEVILHCPPVPHLTSIVVNGVSYPAAGEIKLPI